MVTVTERFCIASCHWWRPPCAAQSRGSSWTNTGFECWCFMCLRKHFNLSCLRVLQVAGKVREDTFFLVLWKVGDEGPLIREGVAGACCRVERSGCWCSLDRPIFSDAPGCNYECLPSLSKEILKFSWSWASLMGHKPCRTSSRLIILIKLKPYTKLVKYSSPVGRRGIVKALFLFWLTGAKYMNNYPQISEKHALEL